MFEYVANIPGTRIRGTLYVSGDTIVVDTENGGCRETAGRTEPTAPTVGYECTTANPPGSIRLVLDRKHPTRSASVSASVPVARRRSICGEWATNELGGKYCVRYINETYYESETRRGSLRFTRIS